jgi:hypothetical protein
MAMTKGRLTKLPSRLSALPPRIAVPAKQADPIYSTPAYQAWRAKVIKRAGGRCQWQEADGPCGRQEPRMFADHVKELRDGGAPFDVENGQCLCGAHHSLKTAAERAKRTASHL